MTTLHAKYKKRGECLFERSREKRSWCTRSYLVDVNGVRKKVSKEVDPSRVKLKPPGTTKRFASHDNDIVLPSLLSPLCGTTKRAVVAMSNNATKKPKQQRKGIILTDDLLHMSAKEA